MPEERVGSLKEQTRDSFNRLAGLPDKWDHNRFYQSFIMRELPESGSTALDVGCGTGEFARLLASRFTEVVGVDLSPGMIEEAMRRNPDPRIEYRLADIEDMDLESDSFDAIVIIAALHHADMDALLPRLRDALGEGGVLAVLDLYLPRTPIEHVLSVIAAPLTAVTDLAVHRGRKPAEWKRLWDEHWSIDRHVLSTTRQVREAAERHLPGFRLRRHLFWRYSLVFKKR